MTTFTIADLNSDAVETVRADTRADALRRVYETLASWNHDVVDCSAAIEAGHINDGGSFSRVLSSTHDAEAFWGRCAALMLNDDQDFAEGVTSPFVTDDDA